MHLRTKKKQTWANRFHRTFIWASPFVALTMLIIVLIPVNTWRLPQNQVVYKGFDPNLIYVKQSGSSFDGVVDISKNAVKLKALHDSSFDVHLLTFSYGGDFEAEFDIRVLDNQQASKPLSIILWNWREGVKYSMDFGSSPDNLLTVRTIVEDTVIEERIIGNYLRGYLYHIKIARYEESGTVRIWFSGTNDEKPPSGHNFLSLIGGPNEPRYREVVTERMAVEGGEEYLFGAMIKPTFGDGGYKLVVDWLDSEGRKLSSSNDWQPFNDLLGWTPLEFEGTAPTAAAFAELRLGAGNGRTILLATDVFLKKANEPGVNLVLNPTFEGYEGWVLAAIEPLEPSERPQIITQIPTLENSITVDQAPSLFAALPVSITLSTSSISSVASVVVEDLRVVVLSQKMRAMRIDDNLARTLVITLLVAGCILIIIRGVLWLGGVFRKKRVSIARFSGRGKLLGSLVLLYLVLNVLLFKMGNHSYDFISAKSWSYITARYSFAELYHLSSIMTQPQVATGTPIGSASFPYGPTMAYVFGAIGWTLNIFLPASELRVDNFLFDIAVKWTNVLFGLFSGILIYLILRRVGISDRKSLIGAMLFLFNPAIWFMMSIWGETHTVSIFFILSSVWLAQNGLLGLAWASLFASALTRPQMLVPALLLGFIYLKSSSLKKNVQGFSFGVIVGFVVLAPFLMALSPSLPVDGYFHDITVQQAQDPMVAKYIFLSNDAYNLWSLVTPFVLGLEGPSRIYIPARTTFFGASTFLDVSNLVFFAVFGLLIVTILLQRNARQLKGEQFGLVATGMLALTMIRTGGSVHHFTLTLPLLLISRKSLKNYAYYSIVSILSVTTLLTMWGSISASLAPSAVLHPDVNPLTRFFTELYISDWFITVGTLANTMALSWLGVEVMRTVWAKGKGKSFAGPCIKGAQEMHSRLRMIRRLAGKTEAKRSIDIGSGTVLMAEIRLDVNPKVSPNIIADVRYLPLVSRSFDVTYFADVIEHIPGGAKTRALREIHRILRKDGELVLSTPNNRLIYTFLDFYRFIRPHRHFAQNELRELLESTGFEVVELFTAGGIWQCVNFLFATLLTLPITKILRYSPKYYVPSITQSREDKEYDIKMENGYTIFVKAKRKE